MAVLSGLLSAKQLAAIREIRTRAWTRPFQVLMTQSVPTTDFYDDPVEDLPTLTLSGDWVWKEEAERFPSPGGVITKAHLLLGCSIDHKALMLYSGARLLVDDIECAITNVSSFEDTAELVVAATQAR